MSKNIFIGMVLFVVMISACVSTGLQKPKTQSTVHGQMTITTFVLESDAAAMHNLTEIQKRELAGVTTWVIEQKTSDGGIGIKKNPQRAPNVIEINVNGKGYSIDVPVGNWEIDVNSGVTFYRMWAGIPDDLMSALKDAQIIILPLAKLRNDWGEISPDVCTALREFLK